MQWPLNAVPKRLPVPLQRGGLLFYGETATSRQQRQGANERSEKQCFFRNAPGLLDRSPFVIAIEQPRQTEQAPMAMARPWLVMLGILLGCRRRQISRGDRVRHCQSRWGDGHRDGAVGLAVVV